MISNNNYVAKIEAISAAQMDSLDCRPQWHQRALRTLGALGKKLEEACPNFAWQQSLDNVCGEKYRQIFQNSVIHGLNEWLKNDPSESAVVVAEKLIPRSLRNLAVLLFGMSKLLARACEHPLKTTVECLQFLVVLAHALTLPETYTGLGAGFIGASAGQAILSPGPQVILGLIIGGSLVLFGLIFGAVKSGASAEEGHRLDAIYHQLAHQIREMPEAAMTGFFVGLILGAVEQVIDPENPIAQAANALDDLGGLSASIDVPSNL